MKIIDEINEISNSIQKVQDEIDLIYENGQKELLDDKVFELFSLKKKLLLLEKTAYLEMEPSIVGEKIDLYLQNIHDMNDKDASVYKYYIALHGTKKIIGQIDARFKLLESELYLGNIGVHIDEEYRGKRYSKQAFLLLRDELLEHGVKKPIFTVKSDNQKSINSLSNIGAQKTGEFVHDGLINYIYEYDLENGKNK